MPFRVSDITFIVLVLVIALAFSGLMASVGEPQSRWLWCSVGALTC